MDAHPDLTGYAHALGRGQAAWRFASPELRRAAAFAAISAAWDIFRRDAGAGDVGPAHETRPAQLLLSEDPRRDAMLLWLADHGALVIAEAATTLARMVGATRRFDVAELALLDAAREALALPTTVSPTGKRLVSASQLDDGVLELLRILAGAVDRLRDDAGFLEGEGTQVRYAMPRGGLSRYVAPAPAGCWALNLALSGHVAWTPGAPLPPGLVSRALFRTDSAADELDDQLIGDAAAAWNGAYSRLVRLEAELARGRDALVHLSRNARTRDAWLLVAALGTCTRTHIARALGLSRAGADIQARALVDAGLVDLAPNGQVAWTRVRTAEARPAPLDQGLLSVSASELDASLAEIDRLLARSAR